MTKVSLLNQVNYPSDVRKLKEIELKQLAKEHGWNDKQIKTDL